MGKLWFILGLIVLALMGCSPAGGDEPEAAGPDTNVPTATPGVVLVTVAAETTLPTIEANDNNDVVITSVAPAGSVDLNQLTSEPPAEGGDLIVQPMPGAPDPLAPLINQASQELARQLGIDVSEVTFVRSVAVDWNDSSLGCPQPGMAYLTVITPGYQLTLSAQGKEYYYHTRGTNDFVYCENAQPIAGE